MTFRRREGHGQKLERIMAKVKHIALIKFKADTSEENIERVFSELLDLSENVPGIEDYVSGPNCSPQGMSQGLTHGFVMTFTDTAARDGYLAHPEHDKFVAFANSLVEQVIVVDFEVG